MHVQFASLVDLVTIDHDIENWPTMPYTQTMEGVNACARTMIGQEESSTNSESIIDYSWIRSHLQIGLTPAILLLLSDIKSYTSFGFLTENN